VGVLEVEEEEVEMEVEILVMHFLQTNDVHFVDEVHPIVHSVLHSNSFVVMRLELHETDEEILQFVVVTTLIWARNYHSASLSTIK
jgi:methionine salvage enolase-phosphatase E1